MNSNPFRLKLELTSICARNATDDDDTPIFDVLRRRIQIMALVTQLRHRRWCIFQREERRHAVRLEAFSQIRRCCCFDRRRAEKTGGTNPDVETAPIIEDVVD